MSNYHKVYQAWQQDHEGFWAKAAGDIDWIKPWDDVLVDENGLSRWYSGSAM